ncbi:aspartate aminotransferase family protein [Hoeflea prorocentri]|uniref:Aspartate aminotransferase family protein n=1 Tax=Hoeflea prorocentri TaxID=1922333 RepID=A0A9X3UJ98_9HYPH|nr:aspartate aminotransferase family protein [Hoeflea prorocentri]MCY6381820.1 aspartate aminotransferase family protein [Hoeflea prorocentri]MDA5399620.1 aspartate aminotransferase family protein [Hoeflea prorocentri]
MTHLPNSMEARDIAYHFHGYTNAVRHAEIGPHIMENGEGVFVTDNTGKRYVEAMAGLWSVALGWGEQRLVRAATQQMENLSFYHNFGHRAHPAIIELAEKLVDMAPVPMSKAYFTNSGSEANDTIMKMIWYRSNALGKPQKKKLISRNRGYHGVTIASGSLTGLPNNHLSFDMPIDRVLHTTCPHYWKEGLEGESEDQFATRCAQDLDAMIQAEGPDTIAAFFAEPVMGAGGVVVPPSTYWEKIQAVLAKYDILLVADEVICGFGRTGRMFASETYDIKPDVMVLSKQITSSYVPFSAFLVNDRFYEPVAEESGRIGVLGHGFTGGGHPVGAAVALENIAIIEERELVKHAAEVGSYFRSRLSTFADHPLVGEVRGIGLIAALEVAHPNQDIAPGKMGAAMADYLLQEGVVSRAMMDACAFCPPLIISRDETDLIIDAVEAGLTALEKHEF